MLNAGVQALSSVNIWLSSGYYHAVPWNMIRQAPGTWWNSANPTELVIPSTGRYWVTANATFNYSSAGTARVIVLSQWMAAAMGYRYLAMESKPPNTSSAISTYGEYVEVSTMAALEVGDIIEVYVLQDAGKDLYLPYGEPYGPRCNVMRVE